MQLVALITNTDLRRLIEVKTGDDMSANDDFTSDLFPFYLHIYTGLPSYTYYRHETSPNACRCRT